jgi:hypothetical protein
MFCNSLFVLLAIVLSVLRFTDSDYPFGIFKLFLTITWIFPGTPVSSNDKIECHDITEILLKVALNTTTLTLNIFID